MVLPVLLLLSFSNRFFWSCLPSFFFSSLVWVSYFNLNSICFSAALNSSISSSYSSLFPFFLSASYRFFFSSSYNLFFLASSPYSFFSYSFSLTVSFFWSSTTFWLGSCPFPSRSFLSLWFSYWSSLIILSWALSLTMGLFLIFLARSAYLSVERFSS